MSSSQTSSRARTRGSTSATSTKPTTNTTRTRNSRPVDRNFQQNLIDHGVYPDEYEYPDGRIPLEPDNWDELQSRLAQNRPSLSPSQFSEGKFRKFKRANIHAAKEKQITDSVVPIIEGDVGDTKCIAGGIPFTNLDHLTDGMIAPGNPDRYYGARPEQLDRQVRKELNHRIVPSTQQDLPVAPNFFLAVKGPNGTAAVAGNQATYDGALGARAMHSLHSYAQGEPIYNNAYTISSVYNDGQLKMYTSHPAQPGPGGGPEYFTTQLNSWSITGNSRTFREGAAAYRNARDWAKEQRDQAIERANGRVKEGANVAQQSVPPIDTSGSDRASSFASQISLGEPFCLSQDSQISLNEGSNTTPASQTTGTLAGEMVTAYKGSTKRSMARPEPTSPLQRKRRNAGGPKSSGHRHRSVSQVSSDSEVYATAEEEEE